ncbi:MAG: TIGR03364 family FAD-dependent oxidoreductase [Bacteroidota bacterium]
MKEIHTEVAIVGAGIVGLAMAYTAAKAGKKVHLFEREANTNMASIRNFGMVWPIGQPAGKAYQRALKSRYIWEEVGKEAGFWYEPKGSLMLIRSQDEWDVAEEFLETTKGEGYVSKLLSSSSAKELSPAAKAEGLLGGLYSATEMIVDPREVPLKISALLKEKYKVQFHYETSVNFVAEGKMFTSEGLCHADQIYVCSGAELETLFPELLRPQLIKVKLQMMRTVSQPQNWRMGPAIYGGLTLQHYQSFAHCQRLEVVKKRIEEESPWFNKWGIHVMMSQNGLGQLVLGDSHEYGMTHDPFLREEIDSYVLDYLDDMVEVPDRTIAARWHGVYAKNPGKTELILHPHPGVTIVNGVGGAGMTFSFGLAKEVFEGGL